MAPDKVRRPIVTETYRMVRMDRGGSRRLAGRGNRSRSAGKGPGGVIEKVLNSERFELAGFKQS
jgi:hypothetical protein